MSLHLANNLFPGGQWVRVHRAEVKAVPKQYIKAPPYLTWHGGLLVFPGYFAWGQAQVLHHHQLCPAVWRPHQGAFGSVSSATT